MNIDKWRKKPRKKELIDIIKIQEEEISRLNREKMKLNVVIRNEKPVRIDTQGLDYMVDLEQKYYVLQDIIKEVREYIKEWQRFPHTNGSTHKELKNLIDILDKEKV